jgi:uncharacterized lipoprotein YmbA
MKRILIAIAVLALAGCTSPEERDYSIEHLTLPEGCTASFAGYVQLTGFANRMPIVVVQCEKKDTTTSNTLIHQGKNVYYRTVASIN